ncbi:MAG: archaeal proteasome endopeptidase complex subunit beta [Candidatus Bathyarchaeota archaeon]|jgi:proteasome beta subunit|nr:archaeal proteasome endopeptidase complex subunit beta [Candidatus Bathyarchaeota archaeon]MDP7443895.1 archaeal proteasome endopeptidase complex subunit beta [Candidatus Bathyarchaeota archaeon]|tara:strand:- start:1727 stop:2332 length:606 start_codon:yes stop_codon:yes gene_type:complete
MGYQNIQGATVVGLRCSDGVVLAAEKRVSWGRMVASRHGKKVFQITPNMGLAFAGLVSDMQAMTREVTAYANLYDLEHNREITVRSMAKLISNMLFQRRMMPLLMESVVGGVDIDGPTLFSMDPVGSLIPDPFITAGSGAPIAMGLVEAKYSESMDLEAGAKLALDAIRSAVARDVVSGDGVDILLIRRDETEERTHTTKS